MNEEKKCPLGSTLWIIAQCGITVLLCVAGLWYAFTYRETVTEALEVMVTSVSGFFGTIFGYVSLDFSLISDIPMTATLSICGIYAWGACVASKLKKRKETRVFFHYLQIALHKLILLIWLILFLKAIQIDGMLASIVSIIGGLWCAGHWEESIESKKRLARRNRLVELRGIRESMGK